MNANQDENNGMEKRCCAVAVSTRKPR